MTDVPDALFPAIEPFGTGFLDVGDGHSVYWEECGNPAGQPALLLHGGPGAPSRPLHRQFFDPGFYRFVTLHQRGCGLSTPLAETRANTTGHLVSDVERLRAHLGVDRWIVVGGSWGTALALAYGQAHPEPCRGFVLNGVMLCRDEDHDWWWEGTRRLYPEAFDDMLAVLPASGRAAPMHAMHTLLVDPDPAVHLPAAKALCLFSAATVGGGDPTPEMLASYDDPAVSLPLARLFLHYSVNHHFIAPGQLLAGLPQIVDKPAVILAGRMDVTTPADAGWALHKAWPGSRFTVVTDAAHSWRNPSMALATVRALEEAGQWAA